MGILSLQEQKPLVPLIYDAGVRHYEDWCIGQSLTPTTSHCHLSVLTFPISLTLRVHRSIDERLHHHYHYHHDLEFIKACELLAHHIARFSCKM